MKKIISKHIIEHSDVLDSVMKLDKSIEKVAHLLIHCLENDGTIFWCGNGGSASDSQHLAGELVGQFVGERRPLKSIALTADSAVMTCIVNDYGYEHVFSRQVEALGSEGDVLVGISTSGNSKNVLYALEAAKNSGVKQVIIVGDPQQLPPTNFFNSSSEFDTEDGIVDDDESILDLALSKFTNRMLRWHYRSRHESLINFSNYHFYNNNLIIPPSANDKFAITNNYI